MNFSIIPQEIPKGGLLVVGNRNAKAPTIRACQCRFMVSTRSRLRQPRMRPGRHWWGCSPLILSTNLCFWRPLPQYFVPTIATLVFIFALVNLRRILLSYRPRNAHQPREDAACYNRGNRSSSSFNRSRPGAFARKSYSHSSMKRSRVLRRRSQNRLFQAF